MPGCAPPSGGSAVPTAVGRSRRVPCLAAATIIFPKQISDPVQEPSLLSQDEVQSPWLGIHGLAQSGHDLSFQLYLSLKMNYCLSFLPMQFHLPGMPITSFFLQAHPVQLHSATHIHAHCGSIVHAVFPAQMPRSL